MARVQRNDKSRDYADTQSAPRQGHWYNSKIELEE